jgi:hypothetical protein
MPISPRVLATTLSLQLAPRAGARAALRGTVLTFDPTQPMGAQNLAIARACAARILALNGALKSDVTVGQLAYALTGYTLNAATASVSPDDTAAR